MSRTISSYTAINAADTDAAFVVLLKLTPSVGSVIRLANNIDAVYYDGNSYSPFPFSIVLPDDINGQQTQAQVIIDNVSRLLIDECRTLTAALDVEVYIVNATATPVTLEASYGGLKLKNIAYDALTLTGRLTAEDYLSEPFPKDHLSAAKFGGLF
jgi:hypothetical protein